MYYLRTRYECAYMFKIPITILMILLIATQTFSKWCLIAEYQVRKEYIAKNLCVNRFNTYSCCKGKCYLTRRLAQDESQQQAPDKGGVREETLLQVHAADFVLPEPVSFLYHHHHSTRHLNGMSQEHVLAFYPPPRA